MGLYSRVAARRGLGFAALALGATVLAACSGGAGASDPGPLADLSDGQLAALGEGLSESPGAANGINVTGTGVVTIDPDTAVLSLGVEETADNVEEARASAAESMHAMREALSDAGVSDEDIETQQFQIQPQYEHVRTESGDDRELTGYRVTNILEAKVRDVDDAGVVIDSVTEAGGDATRINNIHFTVEDGSEAENEARRLAASEAAEKAALYADELGVERGDLLAFSESSGTQFPEPGRVAMDGAADEATGSAGAPTSVEPGEFDVRVTVQAVFDIQQ
ncbi:MAG: SIMPL domain-containing protein [Dehalococcoidia bacterium]